MNYAPRLACCLLSVLATASARGETSALWGKRGEQWSADSRLPDYSYAGYHGGRAIPDVPVVTDVQAHGAKGDGTTDDAPAFLKAIRSVPDKGGAVLVPAGRYVLGQPLVIERGNVVLRGEGEDKTILVIPKSLQQLSPKGFSEGAKLGYSFGGAFVHVKGRDAGKKLATVDTPAKRGERTLVLSTTAGVKKGDAIRVVMGNDKALGRHLHGDLLDAGEATFSHNNFVDVAAVVTAVDGRGVTLDRPLRTDVRPEWDAEVWSSRPTVREMGIEQLSFEFPGTPKQKHLQEEGFNAIHFVGVADCWVRGVTMTDCDLGVKFDASRACTVTGVTFKADKRTDLTGHHALWVSGRTQDVLFDGFDIRTRFVHDLSVEGFANGNVFTRGKAVALNLDHHRNGPFGNLFTELHTADVSRLWQSSGRGDRGPHTAGWETVWNLTYDGGKLPKVPDWPLLNVFGVRGYADQKPADNATWVESEDGHPAPPNLYLDQVERRRQRNGPTNASPAR